MVFLVAVIVTTGLAQAAYVQSTPSVWVDEDDPADTKTSLIEKYSDVDTDAEDWGYAYCRVYTRVWAAAWSRVGVTAHGTAYWDTTWEWEGPPSEPPGGTLTWGIDADGRADAWGTSDPGNGGTASSNADASASAYLVRDYGTCYGRAFAEGSVVNSNTGSGDGGVSGSATEDGPHYEGYGSGFYEVYVDWVLAGNGNDPVASGTSYVHVTGSVYCYGSTWADANYTGSQAEALAQTYSVTDAWFEATLTSN